MVEYYDYRARMYDPKIGRFISPDSVVPDEKNPQAWNRFAYVYNSPLRYTDPSGHTPCSDDPPSAPMPESNPNDQPRTSQECKEECEWVVTIIHGSVCAIASATLCGALAPTGLLGAACAVLTFLACVKTDIETKELVCRKVCN